MSDDNREDAAEAGDGFELSGAAIDEVVDSASGESGSNATDEGSSIFDLFEPPPEIDPNHFGPIPIIGDDDDIEVIDDGPVALDTGFDDGQFVDDDPDPDPSELDDPTGAIDLPEPTDEPAGESAESGEDVAAVETASNGLFDEPRGDAPQADHDDGSVTVDELLAPLETSVAALSGVAAKTLQFG